MICYKDKTFCVSPDCENKCGRQLTKEMEEEAEKLGLPISMSCFCGGDLNSTIKNKEEQQ